MTDKPAQVFVQPGVKDTYKDGRWKDQQILDDSWTLLATIFLGHRPLNDPEVQQRWNELHPHLYRRVFVGSEYEPPGPSKQP